VIHSDSRQQAGNSRVSVLNTVTVGNKPVTAECQCSNEFDYRNWKEMLNAVVTIKLPMNQAT